MSQSESCPDPKGHKVHMCALKVKGMMQELDQRSSNPTVACNRCGIKANAETDVCQPRAL